MTDLTSDIINAVGGDPTSRTNAQNNATSIAQLLAQVQTLQAAVRTVSFTAATYSVTEGSGGATTNLTATMKRTGDLSAALAVTTKFVAGTLGADDFASGSLPGDLTFNFAANSDTATASDAIKGDDIAEPTETMTRYIVPPAGYSFGPITRYTGNVLDDDTAAKVSINGTPPTTGQVGTAYTFTPTTANGSGTKAFSLSGGPLLSGLSFSSTTGAISGTPTASGSMPNLVITVTDNTGSASTTATTVTIAASTAARTVGPQVTTDTGWQDLGTTTHSYRGEAATAGDTGSLGTTGDIYMFCDVGTDTPAYGVKFSSAGSAQYMNLYYRSGSDWVQFQGGDANVNWGRGLLKEDVVDVYYTTSGTVVFVLNGTLNKTLPASVLSSKFPNGLGRYARYAKTGGTYTQKTTLSGVQQG